MRPCPPLAVSVIDQFDPPFTAGQDMPMSPPLGPFLLPKRFVPRQANLRTRLVASCRLWSRLGQNDVDAASFLSKLLSLVRCHSLFSLLFFFLLLLTNSSLFFSSNNDQGKLPQWMQLLQLQYGFRSAESVQFRLGGSRHAPSAVHGMSYLHLLPSHTVFSRRPTGMRSR